MIHFFFGLGAGVLGLLSLVVGVWLPCTPWPVCGTKFFFSTAGM